MNLIGVFISLIIISYLFTFFMKKFKVPEVVSLLILGIFFGYSTVYDFFIGVHFLEVEFFGTLGLFALMFLAGLESSWENLKKEELDSFHIALFSSLVPLFLGFLVMFFIIDFSFIESFVIAICLSITAESAKARVLLEMGVLKSRVASALLGAGIIDDVIGIGLFSILLLVMGIFDFHEHLLLVGVILSFIVGILVQKFAREHHLTKKLEVFLSVCIIPFFFIATGINFTFDALSSSLFLVLTIVFLGIGGKLLGSQLSKPYVDFSYHQLHLIGWAMNSRGALDIAIAVLALSVGIISEDVFSSLIVLAIVSTILFPFIVEQYIKSQPSIMD